MKKIVSTKGFRDGHFDAPDTDTAMRERINPKLEHYCNIDGYIDGEVHVNSRLSYDLIEGQVASLLLSYTINNPTPQRLEQFRTICENFYELHGFLVDNDDTNPCVYYKAVDIYDMASLIHALDFLSVSLESIICPIESDLTEKDAIYSPSGAHLIQLPDVIHYSIREGTLFISPFAARHCTKLRLLDIPVGMLFDKDSLRDYPQGLKIKEWNTHYDGTPAEDDETEEDEPYIVDKHHVVYSEDGKILKFCRYTFNESKYEVPDGVEVIEDFAFIACRHYLELSIPRSVKTIGDNIFGNGGSISLH